MTKKELLDFTMNNIDKVLHKNRVSYDLIDDFRQEIYLIILEFKEEKLANLDEKTALFFISRIVMNQWCSKTSPFYKNYRKFDKLTVSINEDLV